MNIFKFLSQLDSLSNSSNQESPTNRIGRSQRVSTSSTASPYVYGPQDIYQTESKRVIEELVVEILKLPRDRDALESGFVDVLQYVGQARREIAISQNTKDANQFGIPRTTPIPDHEVMCTNCIPFTNYQQLGVRNIQLMTPYVEAMASSMGGKPGKRIRSGEWQYTVRPLFPEKIKEILTSSTQVIAKVESGEELTDEENFTMELGLSLKNLSTWVDAYNIHEDNKVTMTGCLYGTVEKKVNDAWITLTRHFAPLQSQGALIVNKEAAQKFKTGPAIVIIQHTPPYNIDLMNKDMATIFADIVLENSENAAKITQSMAKLTLRFAHTMPFYRGSAASLEYLLQALAKIHSLDWFKIKPGIDQEALSCPFEKRFLKLTANSLGSSASK